MRKRELIFLLSFTCNYVVSAKRGFLFLLVLGIGVLFNCGTLWAFHIIILNTYGPRSDKRDLMAIKVKGNSFTQKERPTYCEQLLKI